VSGGSGGGSSRRERRPRCAVSVMAARYPTLVAERNVAVTAASGGRGGLRDGGSLERELAVASVHEERVALAEAAFQQRRRERVLDEPLQRPLQRTRPVCRVPARLGQQLLRGRCQLDVDAPLRQPSPQPGELELDDLRELLARELLEHDDLVDPVQELRPEALA